MTDKPYLEQLQEELEVWLREHVIGASQARRILAHYGLAPEREEEARREGRLATIFGVLGAILTGIGVILFVASNWEDLDRPYKVLLLLAALVAAYGVGYWLKYGRGDHPRIGSAFIFLGSIIFGANVFLIAQTYHVQANEPLLLAFWAAGALAMAYAAASRPSLYLGILAAVAQYGFWEDLDRPYKVLMLLTTLVVVYGVGYWLKYGRGDHPRIGAAFIFLGSIIFGANFFLIAQTYHVQANEPLLLAFWAAGALAMAYVAVSRPSLYLGILAAVASYGFQLEAWDAFSGVGFVMALAGITLCGLFVLSLGELHRLFRKTQPFSAAFVQLGTVVAFVPMFVFSFADFWRGGNLEAPSASLVARLNTSLAVFAALAVLLTALAVWRQGLSRPSVGQGIGVLALGASMLLVVFHPFGSPEPYAISFNVVLLAGILWAVVLGIWTRREFFIDIGLMFFVILVFARYFDFFWTLMDRSVVFIGAGLLLLGGGYALERYRRRLVREIRGGELSHEK